MATLNRIFLRPKKTMGQNFLVNSAIAEIEAEHAHGTRVLELGPGYGTLTRELCRNAKVVIAVELDRSLFAILKQEMNQRNLKLINNDFFKASDEELELDSIDIMISNVPYKLSSKTIDFLIEHKLQAVLCLQKEFVEHMLAEPGTRKYSRLSVMSQLCFSVTKIMDVSRGNFRPIPRVDSAIIYLKPRDRRVSPGEKGIINALMQHKKKTVKNAILDSSKHFGKSEKEMGAVIEKLEERDSRVFKLSAEDILSLAKRIDAIQKSTAPVSDQV